MFKFQILSSIKVCLLTKAKHSYCVGVHVRLECMGMSANWLQLKKIWQFYERP